MNNNKIAKKAAMAAVMDYIGKQTDVPQEIMEAVHALTMRRQAESTFRTLFPAIGSTYECHNPIEFKAVGEMVKKYVRRGYIITANGLIFRLEGEDEALRNASRAKAKARREAAKSE